MDHTHLVLHGLAIKKHASADAIVGVVGLPLERVKQVLSEAAESGRIIAADGRCLLTPLARVALEYSYSRFYAVLREDHAFFFAYEEFERINITLKSLITDWQTMVVGGKHLPNDHSNAEHDDRIIDRLGNFHETADKVLSRLEARLSRLGFYREGLLEALEKAEDGAIEWVSDATIESYHTLWFELHEDLLRIVGRTRVE